MTAYGPKAHRLLRHQLGSPHQGHQGCTGRQLEGRQIFLVGREGSAIDIVSIADDVPAETKAKVEEVKKAWPMAAS